MPKKSLFVTLFLTTVLMLVSAKLYVSQDFWKNWNTELAYLEVYNAGQKDNSFTFVGANRLKVETPEKLRHPEWLKNSGIGYMMQFKVRSVYRKYSVLLNAFGDGDLKIKFNNYEWGTSPKNINLNFRNVIINGKKVINQELIGNEYVLPYDLFRGKTLL